MADRPILFSAPMVRALLREIAEPGTGKTQTRRVPIQPRFSADGCHNANLGGRNDWWDYWSLDRIETHRFKLPYAVGDRLWVREAWRSYHRYDAKPPRDLKPSSPIYYEAGEIGEDEISVMRGKLRPSMFMPRWASRITLEVTGVKVERLKDCSEADAYAEGIAKVGRFYGVPEADWDRASTRSSVDAYANLWDDINGLSSWEANPWVAAYTFRPFLDNIDCVRKA